MVLLPCLERIISLFPRSTLALARVSQFIPRMMSYEAASVTAMSMATVHSPKVTATSSITPSGTVDAPLAMITEDLEALSMLIPNRSMRAKLMSEIPAPVSMMHGMILLAISPVAYAGVMGSGWTELT